MTARGHPHWQVGLFGDSEVEACLSAQADLDRMRRIEAAWTRCIAPKDIADRIVSLIESVRITPADLADGTARDGLPVPDLVRLLTSALTDDDAQWVHFGLTSQDVIDTAMVLTLQDILPRLEARLKVVLSALDALAARDGQRTLMAMTRMQPALPIRAADRIAAWRRPLAGLAADMPAMSERCAVLQWGGPVGLRDPVWPDNLGEVFARALGLRDPGCAWHSDRGMLADLASTLSRITGATGKIGQDIALLAQTDPDALSLSPAGESSAMPHKQNPVLAELLVTLAHRNRADLGLMHQALLHEQERSGAAWMLEWIALPQMLITTGRSLHVLHNALGAITRIGAAT